MPTRVRLRQCPACRAVQRASAYVLLEDLGPNPLRACPACGWIGSTRALRIVDSAGGAGRGSRTGAAAPRGRSQVRFGKQSNAQLLATNPRRALTNRYLNPRDSRAARARVPA